MDNIKCPNCGSEQISSNKKGWTLTTGAIGMNRIILTCLKCGKQWKIMQQLIINL
jgi:DNA-directed RNA polymerase subunit RPC12/RpoP